MTTIALEQKGVQSVKSVLSHISPLCLATLILPTILSILYFGFVASDIYVSESRYIIRTPQRQAASSTIGSILQSAGFSRTQDDSAAVHDFILSRDAVYRLNEGLEIGNSFSSPDVDRIMRFGGIDWDTSFEALYKYFQRRVQVTIETSTSISTLHVEAFSPEMAYRVNQSLLDMSEDLVNDLNRRASEDLIQFASREVAAAEERSKTAALALSAFRSKHGIFDTTTQSGLQLQQVQKMREDLVSAKSQLAQVQSASRGNPAISVLQDRIRVLNSEIKAENDRVAGSHLSLSSHAIEYQRLILDQQFADKQFLTALEFLESSRNEAARKQMYLERIVNPNKPDVAIEPRRLKLVVATVVLGLMTWGIVGLLIAGVREHRG